MVKIVSRFGGNVGRSSLESSMAISRDPVRIIEMEISCSMHGRRKRARESSERIVREGFDTKKRHKDDVGHGIVAKEQPGCKRRSEL